MQVGSMENFARIIAVLALVAVISFVAMVQNGMMKIPGGYDPAAKPRAQATPAPHPKIAQSTPSQAPQAGSTPDKLFSKVVVAPQGAGTFQSSEKGTIVKDSQALSTREALQTSGTLQSKQGGTLGTFQGDSVTVPAKPSPGPVTGVSTTAAGGRGSSQ